MLIVRDFSVPKHFCDRNKQMSLNSRVSVNKQDCTVKSTSSFLEIHLLCPSFEKDASFNHCGEIVLHHFISRRRHALIRPNLSSSTVRRQGDCQLIIKLFNSAWNTPINSQLAPNVSGTKKIPYDRAYGQKPVNISSSSGTEECFFRI